MKRIVVVCFVLAALFLPAFVFASSCDSEGTGFYINFTLEGVEYSCTFGYTDVEKDPFAAAQLEGIFTYIAGVSGETNMYGEPSGDYAWVEVYFDGAEAATLTGDDFEVDIWIYTGGEYYFYESSAGTLDITTYEEVGGAVAGSFDVTLEGGIDAFALGDPTLATTGSFRVKRIEYDFGFAE